MIVGWLARIVRPVVEEAIDHIHDRRAREAKAAGLDGLDTLSFTVWGGELPKPPPAFLRLNLGLILSDACLQWSDGLVDHPLDGFPHFLDLSSIGHRHNSSFGSAGKLAPSV
jgi:hypothetical protein